MGKTGCWNRVRSLVLLLALFATSGAWAADYTFSNVDSDSLAVKSDDQFGTTSFSFQLNNPSANAATADFPASGYVQLTKISIGARSDNGSQSVTTATLTNNKTSESYAATVTYSSGNDFTAVEPDSWSRKEVKITFGTDGVLVDTTATYTLTFTTTLGYSVVTTVASGTQIADWKPAMRIYGRTPSGSMEMPSSLIPSSGGMALPSTVTVADATGMAFANDSVTIGNSGIQIALASALNYHTIMMKVENIPAAASRLLGWSVNFNSVASSLDNYLSYTGSNLEQHFYYGKVWETTYGSTAWTRDAAEHWVATSYARTDSESGCSQTAKGVRSYIDGTEKVVGTALNWPSLSTDKILIGGIALNSADPATGMVIKDVVILSDALTAAQVATVTAALNKGWVANAAGTTLTGSNVELPDSNNRVTGTITVAANGTYSATLTVVNGVETVGPNATAVLNSAGDYSSATTVSGAGVLKGDFTSNNSLAFNGEFTHSGNVMIGACSGNNTATVTIGQDADVTVSHLRFLNSASTTASATLNVYGTLTVDSVSTSANVWSERGNYKGILFGHWKGTGNYNIYTGGSLIGEAAYLQLVYTAGSQTLAVNGGTLKVRGIQASNGNGALTLSNGGRLELAEGFINSNIAQTYGYGTISAYSYSGSKGWTSSQPATFNDTENGTTIDPAGLNITFSGAISGAGKIIVNDSVGGGKVSFTGDLSGFTGSFEALVGTLRVPSGVTIGSVAGTATVVVPGGSPSDLEAAVSGGYALSGSLNIANPVLIGGSILLVDVNEQEAVNTTTSYEGGVFSFSGTAPVNATYTGNQWWWDYEFNGTVTSIGSDTTGMNQEGSATSFTTADASGNQELYFQRTPYRSASFSDKSELTAVMYCQPGNYANTVLIGFGSTYASNNAIALVTGDHPEQGEMKLVLIERGSGSECTVTPLANMKAVDATTKKHLYAFVMDRITEDETTKTRVRVYLDGKVKAIYKHNGVLTIGDGFQIGSMYGGVKDTNYGTWDTGLTKYPSTGDSGTLDFLRMKDGSLSSGAMEALANAYPYNSAHGEATRDPISSASSWVATDAWTQVVPNQADAIQDAPNADTNVKLSVDGSSAVSVALNLTTDSNYESVTFTKEAGATGSLKITSGYDNNTSGKLVAAESSILVDTTIPAGRVNLGIASVADGVILTVDPYSATGNYAILSILESLPLGGVYEDEIISMALLGEGASVVFDSSALSDLAAAGFTATFVYNESNQSYTFRVERESSADVTVNITALGTTWMAHGVAMPAPETLTLDSANTVTINNTSGSAAEISTAFASGNVTVSSSGTVELSGAITTSGDLTFNSATTLSGTSTISGAVSGTGTLTVSGTVTLTSTGTIANTVVGDGRVVFVGKLPASNLQTSFKDSSNWTGTVEIKDYTETAGTHKIIVLTNYGNGSSTVALNGVTSTMFANTSASSGNYPDVTLKEIEIGEGGWTDNDNLTYGVNMLYKADLTGSGTITVKTSGTGTIQFVGGNHTFNGSVVFGDSTGKQVAFMQSSSDTIPDGTAKSIVVAGGVNMSIASGKSWTAPGGIYVLGTLKVEGTGVANGGVTTQSGATIDLSTFQGETPAISGALTLNGGIIKLPAGTELPYQIAGSGNGAPSSCTIGEDSSRTDVLLKNGQLVATRTATISSESVVTFGSIGWTGTGNDYTLTLSAPTYLTFDSTTVDYLKIYVENGGALHIKGDIPANTTILGLTSLQIASGDTERFKSGYTRLYSQIGNTESGNDALNAGGTISVSSDEAIPAGNYTLARWITPQKMSSGYGHVATLVTTGLADGLTAELVYCVDRIMLRVYNTEEQAAKGTIKVWPYGDSITEGFNAGSTKANYRVLLAQKLSLLGFNVEMVGCYDKINGANGIDPSGQEITNAWKWHSAKHGATAGPTTSAAGRANLCENVDTLCAQAGNPDVVLLLAGANDIVPATGLTAQQVVNSITNIVAHLATNLPDTKIVVGNQIGVEEGYTPGNYNYVVSMIPQVNALLKTYVDNLPAELNGKVFLADLNSYVKSGEYAVLYGGDHLHPDWWGHDQMAEGWLSVITNKFTATQVFPSATVPAAPANDELGAAAKSELAAYRKGFKLARRIDAASNLNTAAPYAATGNGATEGIQKVAYFVEYVRDDNNAHKWVWVDMDAFGDCDLATIGLPATNHQQVVTKLHVKSNHNGIDDVAADDDSVTGFIEFSPFDYNGNVSGVSGAPAGNASCCDWNDTLSDSGTYGCMQVHRVFSPAKSAADGVTRGGQVLFAYNNWRSSTSTAEFGIGNFSSHFYRGANDAQSLDYTYTSGATKMNADAYSVKRIEIWTKKVYGTIFSVW